jgi:hypothetical protein
MQKILNLFFVAQSRTPGILLKNTWKTWKTSGIPLFQSPKNPELVAETTTFVSVALPHALQLPSKR